MHTVVLIVRAGPTGLTLAYELLRQGVQVRLIEKEPTASQNAKALGVWARTVAEAGRGPAGFFSPGCRHTDGLFAWRRSRHTRSRL